MIQIEIDKKSLEQAQLIIGNVSMAAKNVLVGFPEFLAKRYRLDLRNNIFNQKFKLTPLNPRYKKRKIAQGLDPRILLRTHDYVKNIKAKKISRWGWEIGVPQKKHYSGLRYVDLAKTLEFGSIKRHIPPRPVWGLTMVKMFPKINSYMNKYVSNLLKGITGINYGFGRGGRRVMRIEGVEINQVNN